VYIQTTSISRPAASSQHQLTMFISPRSHALPRPQTDSQLSGESARLSFPREASILFCAPLLFLFYEQATEALRVAERPDDANPNELRMTRDAKNVRRTTSKQKKTRRGIDPASRSENGSIRRWHSDDACRFVKIGRGGHQSQETFRAN